MKINFKASFIAAMAITFLGISSCSKENTPFPEEPNSGNQGVYVLNEGTYGLDDASLSFFNSKSKTMQNHAFVSANPSMKLGSLGNDIGVYGTKLYVTVNGSNKLEIADATTNKSLKTIEITAPSSVAFHGKHAFVSSYTNQVFVIDTASLVIVKAIKVGRTPEKMAVSGNRLFVANAGWKDGAYGLGEYDNTVSVIDALGLEKIKDVVIDKNVDKVYADNKGKIYVMNSAIYGADFFTVVHPARLYVLDAAKLEVEQSFDFSGNTMAIKGNQGYIISTNYEAGKTLLLEMNLDTYAVTVNEEQLNGLQSPYGLGVDPLSGDLWIGDALDYSSNGKVFRFSSDGSESESYTVGVSPRKIVFKH